VRSLEAFETPQKAINWARSNIEAARQTFVAYAQNNPLAFVIEEDPETGDKIHKFKLVKQMPDEIEHLCRNAIVDLKHSFDQSLSAAARTLNFVRFDKNYPWADSVVGLKRIIDQRQTKKDGALPQILIDEIYRQKPYSTAPGLATGNNLIREIAKMANDKHTIGIEVTANVASYIVSNLTAAGPSELFRGWDPVKQELIFAIVKPGGSISYNKPQIAANICFKRAGDIGKIGVFDAAEAFADRAQAVLDGFKAVCA